MGEPHSELLLFHSFHALSLKDVHYALLEVRVGVSAAHLGAFEVDLVHFAFEKVLALDKDDGHDVEARLDGGRG